MGRARWLRVLALLGTLMLVASACGNDDSGEGANDGGGSEEIDFTAGLTGESVKVGVIVEESGTALANPEIPEGAQAAQLLVNEAGGIQGRPVEVLVCDTANDPNQAAQCGRDMVDEGVVALSGVLSVHADQFMPLMEQEQIPSIAHIPAGVPGFTSPAAFPFIGGAVTTVGGVAQGLAELGAKRIAVARPDIAAGAALPGFLESALENEDVEVVNDVAVPEGTADAAPFVEAALKNDADAIAVFLSGIDATNFIIAARQAEPDLLVGSFSTDIAGLTEALGKDLSGIVTSTSSNCPFDTAGCNQYEDAMKHAGFDETGGSRILAYSGVIALAVLAEDLPEITGPAVFQKLNQTTDLGLGTYPPLQFVEGGVLGLPRIFNPCIVPEVYDENAEAQPLSDTLIDPFDDVACADSSDAVQLGSDTSSASEE